MMIALHKQARTTPVVDGVVGAVNDAMNDAKHNETPRAKHQPTWDRASRQRYRNERIEEHRNFEQISEVVCGLHVLEACGHLCRCLGCLRVNSL